MANRYYFRVPYSCTTYGDMTGYVVAENEDEAVELIQDGCTDDEEYSNEESENYNYSYDDASFDIRETDVALESAYNCERMNKAYPKYFLSEINLI